MEHDTHDNIEDAQSTYMTSEVAKMIGIAPTTVRKYAQSLSDQDYSFFKGKGTGHRQARLFTDKDVTVIRYLKEIREKGNISVNRATAIVVERFGKKATQETLPINQPATDESTRHDKQHEELKEMVTKLSNEVSNQSEYMIKQNELIGNLINRIDQQDEYISKQIEFPMSEKPKEIEAPKQDEAKQVKNKKSLLARIFNM